MRLSRFPLYGALSACVLPAALAAQNGAKVPPRAFTTADAEFEEPFTQISGLRELSDGRVIVSDTREKTVRLVDFRTGTVTPIGREGSGPNEFAMPMATMALPGDTTIIYDPLNSRFLVVDPKGKPAGTFSLQQEVAVAGGGRMRGFGGRPKGVDRQGRIYFLASNFMIGPDGQPQRSDSAPITRYDRTRKKTDTVTFIKMPQMNVTMGGNRPRPGAEAPTRISITATSNPFEPADEWVVAPDGRIGVVRSEPYRVEWITPGGARTAGPVVAYEKLRVTDADKKAWREGRARATTTMSVRTGGPGGSGSQARTETVNPRDIPEPTDWPEFKPPFLRESAFASPDGGVWVLRTQPAGARGMLYDIFDARGQLVGRASFPDRTRLVGFGKGVAYVVRWDEDDLQYLQRYKL